MSEITQAIAEWALARAVAEQIKIKQKQSQDQFALALAEAQAAVEKARIKVSQQINVCVKAAQAQSEIQAEADAEAQKKIEAFVGQVVEDDPLTETPSKDRAGCKWSDEEDKKLRDNFAKGLKVPALAEAHRRAPGGITARLKHLGLLDKPK